MTDPRTNVGHLHELPALKRRLEQLEQQNAELRQENRRLSGPGSSGAPAGDPADRGPAAERYRRLLDTAADFVFIHPYDQDPGAIRFTEVNAETCRRLGYTPEEMARLGPLDVTVADDAASMRPESRDLDRDGELLFEKTLLARDGTRIPVEIRSRRYREQGQEMVISVARDVSARRRMRDSLDALIDAHPDSALLISLDGRILAANRAVAQRFGFASRNDLLGRNAYGLVEPEVAASRATHVRRAIETRRSVSFRDERRGRIIDNVVRPVLDGAGEVVSLAIHGRDVTDDVNRRRDLAQQERRLQASESQLELFFHQVPVAIFIGGPDGVIARANPAAEAFVGRGPGELAGVPFADLSHPEDLAADLEAFARLTRGETPSYSLEKRFVRADGEVVWGALTAVAAGEDPHLVFAIVEDITREKTEQEARREQELERQRLLTAIEQSEESVVITDVDAAIEYVNAAFERITGYTAAEVRGENPSLLKSGEHDDDFYREMWTAITSGESWSGRLTNRRKDGTLFHELATISPVRDASGEIAHFVAVKRDITHELELEAQVRQSQKMEALGNLAGGIAHDFNNILYALMGNTELALARVDADDELASHLRSSLSACHRASDLVRRILAFGRRHERRRAVQDPAVLARDVIDLLESTLPATVQLEKEIAPDCPPVNIDRTEWHQVLMNLATNAVQALPEGKGRLEIRIEPSGKPVAGRGRQGARAVCLTVRDSGVGMTPEVLARCCDPYFTTKPPGMGTGMGLSIVHGIVTSLGGRLDVRSVLEVGTTVQVVLPAALDQAGAAPPSPAVSDAGAAEGATDPAAAESPAPAPPRARTVMVVEDEAAILRLASTALARRRYRVLEFQDPREALAAFCDDPDAVDLVVTDQTMPGITGLDLAREMLGIRGDLPVIICSGYSESFQEDDLRERGIRAYLPKPVPLADLVAAVRRELGEAGPA